MKMSTHTHTQTPQEQTNFFVSKRVGIMGQEIR